VRVETFLRQSAAADPDRIAITAGDTCLSYGALDSASDRLAAALIAHGAKRGDRIAVLMENVPEAQGRRHRLHPARRAPGRDPDAGKIPARLRGGRRRAGHAAAADLNARSGRPAARRSGIRHGNDGSTTCAAS
jgi:hypothetical protein